MRSQLEGSQAVARAVALCRPEVISAYPISPQTHIVEALRPRPHRRARALRVPDGRVRVRGDVGGDRRLRGRCARIHGDGEPGPPLHGRGPLQRRRARLADRDDGREPRHRRADQHLERPQRLDVAARFRLDPALRRVEPGRGRPARAGVQARGGAVDAGDGLHGRLRAHPRRRAGRRAGAGAGRRVPAPVRAAAGARPGRAGDDRRDGRAGGVHRGQVSDARQADAGSRPRTRAGGRVRAGVRAHGRRPRPALPQRRRGHDRRRARLRARDDRGHGRRAARAGLGSARSGSRASGPSRSTSSARR